eukprot:gene6134-12420_t
MILSLLTLSRLQFIFGFKRMKRFHPNKFNQPYFTRHFAKEIPYSWDTSQGTTLVIVESPAKVKTIQKYLGDEYIVDYCAGHIRDLPNSAKEVPAEFRKNKVINELKLTVADLGIDVYNNFEPLYIEMERKGDIMRRLRSLSKKCSRILLATDEDREGEAISWHLIQLINPTIPYKRAVFNEITKDAILEAFKHPRDIDMDLVQSQETRRILDRLAGYTVSPILWRYICRGLSAGRVQSCGLHLISERERKRWEFIGSNYYSIEAAFLNRNPSLLLPSTHLSSASKPDMLSSSSHFIARLHSINGHKVATDGDFDGRTGEVKTSTSTSSTSATATATKKDIIVLDKNMTNDVIAWLSGNNNISPSSTTTTTMTTTFHSKPQYIVNEIKSKKISKKAPLPYITSTLQQEASNKLGLSPWRTMSIAQGLYEAGHITYMRTDSPVLSSVAVTAARNLVLELFGENFLGPMPAMKKTSTTTTSTVITTEDSLDKDGNKEVSDTDTNRNSKKSSTSTSPKNAQEAHEAIRPAEVNGRLRSPAELDLDADEYTLYKLIYCRTLASTKLTKKDTVSISINDNNVHTDTTSTTVSSLSSSTSTSTLYSSAVFKASFTEMTFDGFYRVFTSTASSSNSKKQSSTSTSPMILIKEGDEVWLSPSFISNAASSSSGSSMTIDVDIETDSDIMNEEALSSSETGINAIDDSDGITTGIDRHVLLGQGLIGEPHATRPPSRFTESSFIKELETVGVGRPSTYSKIFQILKERGYIIVDKQTMLPTVKGMLVSQLLRDHFPVLVDPQFTALMEEQLDKIAAGLLKAVVAKLVEGSIDHKVSRTLDLPFLRDVASLQLSSSGIFVEELPSSLSSISADTSTSSMKLSTTMLEEIMKDVVRTDNDNDNDDMSLVSDTLSSSETSTSPTPKLSRWMLPEEMQNDIRFITRESITSLIASNSTTTQGIQLGIDDISKKPLALRSGRYGPYLQLGLDTDKTKTLHSVPVWFDSNNMTIEDALTICSLPKVICIHPTLNLPVILDVTRGNLTVGVQKYPYRSPLPPGTRINDVTADIALSMVPEEDVTASQRSLGMWKDETVWVRQGRFGFYLMHQNTICGLRKLDPLAITLEEAIEELTTRGKTKIKTKKSSRKSKTTKTKSSAKADKTTTSTTNKKKALTGYQMYVQSETKKGYKMTKVASTWKLLSDEMKETYKNIALNVALLKTTQLSSSEVEEIEEVPLLASLLPSLTDVITDMSTKPKTKSNTMVSNKGNTKTKTSTEPTKQTKTKKTSTKTEAKLDSSTTTTTTTPKKSSISSSSSTNTQKTISKPEVKPSDVKPSGLAGYQYYLKEQSVQGVGRKDAINQWKLLSDSEKTLYKEKLPYVFI